jgi:hypothetical protein
MLIAFSLADNQYQLILSIFFLIYVGCSVAFLSICRIVQLALIISLTFDLEAPNFACVEFAFNRQVENDSTETFSTPLLDALQSIFYFFFFIAGNYYAINVC